MWGIVEIRAGMRTGIGVRVVGVSDVSVWLRRRRPGYGDSMGKKVRERGKRVGEIMGQVLTANSSSSEVVSSYRKSVFM